MNCPFLRESQAKFCQASPFRKMIVEAPGDALERCASPAYVGCASFQDNHGHETGARCPFLHSTPARYCAEDPALKVLPSFERTLSRCLSGNHRYCSVYLTTTRPLPAPTGRGAGDLVGGMPPALFFAPNHMWLEIGSGDECHVGLDALASRAFGAVDKLAFVSPDGERRPSVVLTVQGTSFQMVFPNPMRITASNTYLRANSERLQADPYGTGWLFEGVPLRGSDIREGLLSGDGARRWMEKDVRRLSEMVQSGQEAMEGDTVLLNDGGEIADAAFRHVRPERLQPLFNEFFQHEDRA